MSRDPAVWEGGTWHVTLRHVTCVCRQLVEVACWTGLVELPSHRRWYRSVRVDHMPGLLNFLSSRWGRLSWWGGRRFWVEKMKAVMGAGGTACQQWTSHRSPSLSAFLAAAFLRLLVLFLLWPECTFFCAWPSALRARCFLNGLFQASRGFLFKPLSLIY